MNVVQVTGLPGTGKTTGIRYFLKSIAPGQVSYLDINNFKGINRERLFREAIKQASRPLIVESACGVYRIPSYIVRINTPLRKIYSRLLARDKTLDEDYLSLLRGQIIAPHATINSSGELPVLLKRIFIESNIKYLQQ